MAKRSPATKPTEVQPPEPGFEEALTRLEGILEALEHGNMNLEEAVQTFAEGVELVKFCHQKLDAVERRVELILKDETGRFLTRPFPEDRKSVV